MRKTINILLMGAALGLAAGGCEDGPGDWGPECEHLSQVYNECIPAYCEGKSCEMCECWNDGYPGWSAAGDCLPPGEDTCAGAAGYIEEFGCDGIQSSYARLCE